MAIDSTTVGSDEVASSVTSVHAAWFSMTVRSTSTVRPATRGAASMHGSASSGSSESQTQNAPVGWFETGIVVRAGGVTIAAIWHAVGVGRVIVSGADVARVGDAVFVGIRLIAVDTCVTRGGKAVPVDVEPVGEPLTRVGRIADAVSVGVRLVDVRTRIIGVADAVFVGVQRGIPAAILVRADLSFGAVRRIVGWVRSARDGKQEGEAGTRQNSVVQNRPRGRRAVRARRKMLQECVEPTRSA